MKLYFDELDATGVKMLNALVDAYIDFAVYYDVDSEAMILELKGLKPRDGGWINPHPYTFPIISWGESNKTIPQYTYTFNPSTAKYTLDDQ